METGRGEGTGVEVEYGGWGEEEAPRIPPTFALHCSALHPFWHHISTSLTSFFESQPSPLTPGFILINANVTSFAHGVYYHTAMFDGAANQLGDMVPADRIFSQLGAFVNYANSTEFFVDNLSDVLPVSGQGTGLSGRHVWGCVRRVIVRMATAQQRPVYRSAHSPSPSRRWQ